MVEQDFPVLGDPVDVVRGASQLLSLLQWPILLMCLDSHGWSDSKSSSVRRDIHTAAALLTAASPLASTDTSKLDIHSLGLDLVSVSSPSWKVCCVHVNHS